MRCAAIWRRGYRGVAAGRVHLRPRRIRGAHRLAADPDERDLGSAGAAVLCARGARASAPRAARRCAERRWGWRSLAGITWCRRSRRCWWARCGWCMSRAGWRQSRAVGARRDLRRGVAAGERGAGAAGHRVRQAIAALGGCAGTAALGTAGALRRARAILAGWPSVGGIVLPGISLHANPHVGFVAVLLALAAIWYRRRDARGALVRAGGARRSAAGAGQGLPAVLADLPLCTDGGEGARAGDGDRALSGGNRGAGGARPGRRCRRRCGWAPGARALPGRSGLRRAAPGALRPAADRMPR